MKHQNIDVIENGIKITLNLGRQGEYNVRDIKFDMSDFQQKYGDGTATIVHFPANGSAYTVPSLSGESKDSAILDGESLIWTIGKLATRYDGNGIAIITWVTLDGLKKSIKYNTYCKESVGDYGAEKSAQQSYIDQMIELASTITDLSSEFSDAERIAVEIVDARENAVSDIETLKNESVSAVNTAKSESIEDIGDSKESALDALNTAKQTALTDIESAKQNAETDINAEILIAETHANNASQSATNASNSATNASNSADSADQSAASAQTSATNASNSAANASQYADNASLSANSASQSATSAQTSANNASTSEQNARQSAEDAQDILDSVQAEGNTQISRVQAKGQEVLDSLPEDFTEVQQEISALNGSLNYLANSEQIRVYPVWENGGINGETGDDVASANSVRSGYIDKNAVALWNVETHSGALYVFRYNYTDGAYTYLGRDQRTSNGNFTNWLKSLAGTHLRFVSYQANTGYPNTWMTLCYSTQIGKDIESLKETQTKSETIESNLGYWRQYLEIPAGNSHSSTADILPVDIRAGKKFMIKLTRNVGYGIQIYALYADGTKESIGSWSARDFPYSKSLYHFTANKDIIGISQYAITADAVRTCVTEVILANGITDLIDYNKAERTAPRIIYPDGVTYFETGRARYDVNAIHQSIAVWNNQVWEFGEGKATYNGIVYELENGHGNTCNWGITLHGNYPYLYCPTWTNNETKINVFTFDGTAFTLDHVINIELTGYMDAYVDEFSERIYVFTYINNMSGVITFTIADLSGNILSTKEIPYRIPVIQGMCLHNGVLYVTSGYATQEFPNYLNLISTDGTLLGRYPMYNIGEIEGVEFMDNEMILASYYMFYIHPTKLPKPFRLSGIFDQLEATT